VTLAELSAREAAPEQAAPEAPAQGDAERGKQLVRRYECNRCHDGTGLGSAPLTKNCFACHQQILDGRFPVSAAALLRFRPHVTSAREAPSLSALGSRLESSWVRDYLLAPRDLRPLLTPTMPRLALDPTQALDIASYLTEGAQARAAAPSFDGSVERGRELMDQKGCAGCHSFGGVPAFTALDPAPAGSAAARAAALAPDLRFTRERFRKDQLLTWLLDPKALKPDTLMPSFGLSVDEANDIASYVLRAELAPEVRPPFVALPLLTRRVSFEEVNREVFSRTCHHCHTDADSSGGDGGPGNTGGFGFAPRGVSFSSHASILAGYVDEHGQRRSLFEPLADGTPRLLGALLARHDELDQMPRGEVRGMPLALPPLSAEQIRLVASWVAQGKPL
jgi:mono/diheme cytochrome c family protein